MLKVVDHQTGAATAYDTLAEAVAAGRFLADQLARGRLLPLFVEQASAGELLIAGEVQDPAGAIIDVVPLVWVVAEMPPSGQACDQPGTSLSAIGSRRRHKSA